MVSFPSFPTARRGLALAALLMLALLAFASMAGCGSEATVDPAPVSPALHTDALVLDVSESVRATVMSDFYAPAATQFARAAIERGSDRLCVAYGGGEVIAGDDKCMPVPHAASGPKAKAELAQTLNAFNGGIAAIGNQRSSLAGGSAVLEMIAAVAPMVGPGSRILVASDMIENSDQVGDFAAGALRFDDAGRQQILEHLKTLGLLPTLNGVAVIVPFPLTHGDVPSNLDVRRKTEIREVWDAWAAATGATLVWGGQPDA